MIDMKIEHEKFAKFQQKFAQSQRSRRSRITNALSDAAEIAVGTAKTPYLTGRSLKVRTGRLRSSVTKDPRAGATVVGQAYSVKIGTNVVYGRVWELGGDIVIPAHTRIINKAFGKALPSPVTVSVRSFIKRVKARPFLQPAIRDSMNRMRAIVVAAGAIMEE